MDREVVQQPLQGEGGRSPGQEQVTVPARDARGLVVGSVQKSEPQAMEFERPGAGAMACGRGMTGMPGTIQSRMCTPMGSPQTRG